MGVFTPEECEAREAILLLHYVGTVEIEVKCMIDMMNQHIIPSMKSAQLTPSLVANLSEAVARLKQDWETIHHTEDLGAKATLARVLRLDTMEEVRALCDSAEGVCPANLWTLSTYKDMLFIDQM